MRVHLSALSVLVMAFPLILSSSHYTPIDSQSCDSRHAPCSSFSENLQENINSLTEEHFLSDDYIFTIITFKNAQHNSNLQDKFRITVTSLLAHSSVGLLFLIIGDRASQQIAKSILGESAAKNDITTKYQVAEVDAEWMAAELHTIVEPMQRYFSSKQGSYYSDSLFFLSIAIHRVLPVSIKKAVMLDADLKFMSDIKELYSLFSDFSSEQVIGIARENQPVYRHTFSHYRSYNVGTRVGEPPPNGLTGFNSGVLLLNLEAMRSSNLYNSLLNEETIEVLSTKYKFKGHLGDQDFFTLISLDYEHLFYILPCGWNRQLCTWWRDHGYEKEFNDYYECNETVSVYHGNCNTAIPGQ